MTKPRGGTVRGRKGPHSRRWPLRYEADDRTRSAGFR